MSWIGIMEMPSERLGQFTRKESRGGYLEDYPRERV